MKLISKASSTLCCSSPLSLAHQILNQRDIQEPTDFLHISLKQLDNPFSLLGLDKALSRLIDALEKKEIIAIISDHDCDGQTACAVLTWSLLNVFHHPKELLLTYIGHRTEEGYGLSSKLCERLLQAEQLPSVIITADCGSSDHSSIEFLSKNGIDVIVTDHHTVPSYGVPPQAFSVINPNQPGCSFPDKNIAGCFVAWFVMAALRNQYQLKSASPLRSMAECLDFVSIGTMSDCVSLKKSTNNRIVLKYGLKLIREQRRPCWRVLRQVFTDHINSDFLIFKIIPLINADGRLFDALSGVSFLLSPDVVVAQESLAQLIQTNNHRKYLQKKQLLLADQIIAEKHDLESSGIIVNLGSDGHHGIHGVTASRLLSQYQRVTIIFSPHHEPGFLSGSARSPESISVKKLLDDVALSNPNLLKRYGGHHQAAGLCIAEEDFDLFKKIALELLKKQLTNLPLMNDFYFEGILPNDIHHSVDFFSDFEQILEPFGKDFNRPIFAIKGSLLFGKVLGESQNHLQLSIQTKAQVIKSMFFFVDNPEDIILACEREECLYIGEFMIEEFQKKKQIALFLKGIYGIMSKNLWKAQECLSKIIIESVDINPETKMIMVS